MRSKRFVLAFLFLSCLIGLLQLAGVRLSIYYEWYWFDMLVHTLAGVWVGLGAYAFYAYIHKGSDDGKKKKVFIFMLASVFVVGVLWEFLELYTRVMSTSYPGYAADTFSDLSCDMLGGILSCFSLKHLA